MKDGRDGESDGVCRGGLAVWVSWSHSLLCLQGVGGVMLWVCVCLDDVWVLLVRLLLSD